MSLEIDINNRNFWECYVKSVQFDAGTYLGEKPDRDNYCDSRVGESISHRFRPTLFDSLSYTDRSFNLDLSSNTTHQYSTVQPTGTEVEKNRRNTLAKIGGVIVMIAGGFLFGYSYNKYSQQNATSKYTNEVLTEFEKVRDFKNDLHVKFHKLIKSQYKIDEINTSRINKYVLSALGVLVGGAILAGGAFAAVPWVIIAGQVTLLISTTLAAYTFGVHWNDKSEITKQYRIILGSEESHGLADLILLELNNYDTMMQPLPLPENPELHTYQPLFPQIYREPIPSAPEE